MDGGIIELLPLVVEILKQTFQLSSLLEPGYRAKREQIFTCVSLESPWKVLYFRK